jgi:hypothetical protein
MRCEGTHYSARSGLAVTRDEKAIAFTSGDAGVQVLVLQYPRRDTPPESAPIK